MRERRLIVYYRVLKILGTLAAVMVLLETFQLILVSVLSWEGIIIDLISSPLFLQLYYQVLNFGMIVSSALMIWKGLMVITGSESPIVVVLR